MKRLLDVGNVYVERCNWTDFALVKLCLCAMGVMIGCAVPQKRRGIFTSCALVVFFATYLPLVTRLLSILLEKDED